MNSAGTVFDVSAVSAADYRLGNRTFHLLGLLGSIILGAGWMAVLVDVAARGGIASNPTFSIVILGFTGGIVILLIWIAMAMSPGATEVQVADTGVLLRYSRGRTTEFEWCDPRVNLTLYEFPRIMAGGRSFPFPPLWLVTHYPQSNPLTPEAFDAIIGSARSAGLLVTRSQSVFGTPRSVIRIRSCGSRAR